MTPDSRNGSMDSIVECFEIISATNFVVSKAATIGRLFGDLTVRFSEFGLNPESDLAKKMGLLCEQASELSRAGKLAEANVLVNEATTVLNSSCFNYLLTLRPSTSKAVQNLNQRLDAFLELAPSPDHKESLRDDLAEILVRVAKHATQSREIGNCARDFARLLENHFSTSFGDLLRKESLGETSTPQVTIKGELIKPVSDLLKQFAQSLSTRARHQDIQARQVGGFLVIEIALGPVFHLNETSLRHFIDNLTASEQFVFKELRMDRDDQVHFVAAFNTVVPSFSAYHVAIGSKNFLFPCNELISRAEQQDLDEGFRILDSRDLFGLENEIASTKRPEYLLLKSTKNHVLVKVDKVSEPANYLAETREPTQFSKLGFAGMVRPNSNQPLMIWDLFFVVEKYLSQYDGR